MRSNFVSFIVELIDKCVIGPIMAHVVSQTDGASVRIVSPLKNPVVIDHFIIPNSIVKSQENQLRNFFGTKIVWRICAHAKTIG